jgi:hypothetical protein
MAMKKNSRRLLGAIGGLTALTALCTGSAVASVPVDLRVASDTGGNLADVRQYVPSTNTIKTYAGDDCFDPTPPIKQSSGMSYPQGTPTMLSAIQEASEVVPALQPLRISDADYQSFNALSICQINAKTPPGFFFLKSNHQGLQVGSDLFTLVGGEELLAFRTPPDFSADEELELTAPTRTAPGVGITVTVRAYTTTLQPRAGATVTGGDSPVQTDAGGRATVAFSTPGPHTLVATADYNDIPSATLSVCVDPDPARACPSERGREILGSEEAEGIKGTDGPDVIRPRDGDDRVKARGGADRIISKGGGRDFVNCGGGKDVVKRDAKDRLAKNCETAGGKKKTKKGGGKK